MEIYPCTMHKDPIRREEGSGGGLFNRVMSPGSTQDIVLVVTPWH